MYDSIVVPVDGSDCASAAAEAAIQLAGRFDAEVSLLAVVEQHALPLPEWPPEAPTREDLGDSWRLSLDRLERRAMDSGVPCTTTVEAGTPHEEIETHVDRVDPALVAIGTHGRSGSGRPMLGSVTERVLRGVDLPILTVPEAVDFDGVDDVLVPTDGSPGSDRAARHACDLAERYGATVYGLSVVDMQALAVPGEPGTAVAEAAELVRDDRERDVATVGQEANARGLDYTTTVVEGSPKQAICEHADTKGVDLVAMGTHGRSGAGRLLLGSVTERTVRECDCPVLAVPLEH